MDKEKTGCGLMDAIELLEKRKVLTFEGIFALMIFSGIASVIASIIVGNVLFNFNGLYPNIVEIILVHWFNLISFYVGVAIFFAIIIFLISEPQHEDDKYYKELSSMKCYKIGKKT